MGKEQGRKINIKLKNPLALIGTIIPQFGCLVFTLCPTSSFAICRQCAQMFSMALGEEVTAEILQCKQLGNAAVHQVPWGREGGPWRKVRRDEDLGERLNHS